MANIGDILLNPELGWKRYDDTDVNLAYLGAWTKQDSSTRYNGTFMLSSNVKGESKVRFNFTGDKIRIIADMNSTRSTSVLIAIDGLEEYFSTNKSTGSSQVLVYEKLNLSDSEHFVEIINNDTRAINFDAIDIDEKKVVKKFNQEPIANKILLSSNDGRARKIVQNIFETPVMTSNTEPLGEAIASTAYYPAFKAFDGVLNSGAGAWQATVATNSWLSYTFDIHAIITTYEIYTGNSNMLVKRFRFEGSNDGVSWTILDEQEITFGGISNTWMKFEIPEEKVGAYKTYRIFAINNNGGARIAIPELKLYGEEKYILEVTAQSEQSFINHGMSQSDLASIDMSSEFTDKHYIQDEATPLDEGKVFKHGLDMTKIIKKVSIQ